MRPNPARRPFLEHLLGSALAEAIVVGYGDLDSFLPHCLETLGCMVERRAGAETGVAAVEYLEGEAVWAAGEAGLALGLGRVVALHYRSSTSCQICQHIRRLYI
jgi:hypothetical protein